MQLLRLFRGSTDRRLARQLWSGVRLPTTARALILPLLVVLGVVAAAGPARAQGVVFASSSFNSGGAQASWDHVVPAGGQNRYLLVNVGIRHSMRAPVVTEITFGSSSAGMNTTQQLARLGAADFPGQARAEIWGLPAPVEGTGVVSVRMDTPGGLIAGALSFTGVHQSASAGPLVSNMGTGAAASLAVPSATGQAIASVYAGNGVVLPVARSPHVGRWSFQGLLIGAGGHEPGRTGAVVVWDTPGSDLPWLLAGISLNPAQPLVVDAGSPDLPPDTAASPDAAPDVAPDVALVPDTAAARPDSSTDLAAPADLALASDGPPDEPMNPGPDADASGRTDTSAGGGGSGGSGGSAGAAASGGTAGLDAGADGVAPVHASYQIGCACSLRPQEGPTDGASATIIALLALFTIRRRALRASDSGRR